MIPLPSNYQDPHGLTFGPDAVVVVQTVNSSSSQNRSLAIGPDAEYVEQSNHTYTRIDFNARIFVSDQAFLEGKKGIPFYNPQGQDFMSIENVKLTGDLVALCERHIEGLY
ncbi:MAG: hypothetical protein ACK4ML_00730 [Alishewanella aestuarii]